MLAPEVIQRTWPARVPLRTVQCASPVQVPSGSRQPGALPSEDGFRSLSGAIRASGAATGTISAKPAAAQEGKSGLASGMARSAAHSWSWTTDGAGGRPAQGAAGRGAAPLAVVSVMDGNLEARVWWPR